MTEMTEAYAWQGRNMLDSWDGQTGRGTSGPTTDEAMTRSEEEVGVGTENRETGRARLRKYVVTEQVTQTVPVQRKERIETDAPDDRAS